MLNQKKHRDLAPPKNKADERIAEIRARIEKLLKSTKKLEVELARKERELRS